MVSFFDDSFSFSSVSIQAQGRNTILKLIYRNTTEILAVARAFADELLNVKEAEEDQAPTVLPMSAGRHGPRPLQVKLPTLKLTSSSTSSPRQTSSACPGAIWPMCTAAMRSASR
jgi:hypothetical protein